MVSSRHVFFIAGLIVGSLTVLAAPTPTSIDELAVRELVEIGQRDPSLFSVLKPMSKIIKPASKLVSQVFKSKKKAAAPTPQEAQQAERRFNDEENFFERDILPEGDLEELGARDPGIFSFLKPMTKVFSKVIGGGKKKKQAAEGEQQQSRDFFDEEIGLVERDLVLELESEEIA